MWTKCFQFLFNDTKTLILVSEEGKNEGPDTKWLDWCPDL